MAETDGGPAFTRPHSRLKAENTALKARVAELEGLLQKEVYRLEDEASEHRRDKRAGFEIDEDRLQHIECVFAALKQGENDG